MKKYKILNNVAIVANFIYFLIGYLVFQFGALEKGFWEEKFPFVNENKTLFYLIILAITIVFSIFIHKFFVAILGKKPPKDKNKYLVGEIIKMSAFEFISIVGLIFILGFGFEWKYILFFIAGAILMWKFPIKKYPEKIKI